MKKQKHLFWNILLVVAEVLFITFLDYELAETYYSLDVLYCLPVIQAARLGAIRAMRRSDTILPDLVGIFSAIVWSIAEAAITFPVFPLNAVALNIFTRSVTFTVIGRVIAKLWREREYARKDALTDLANRLELFERFETEQLRSERSGIPYSVLFIDIDQFKVLNDNHGHHVGDDALKKLADILRENSRKVDTVARLGGDEFALLFPETDEQSCEMFVSRIKLASEREFQSLDWQISLSIGHVTEVGKKRSIDEILREADEKMYAIKKRRQPNNGEMIIV